MENEERESGAGLLAAGGEVSVSEAAPLAGWGGLDAATWLWSPS